MSVKQEKMGRTQITNASEKLEMQVKSRKKLKKKKKTNNFKLRILNGGSNAVKCTLCPLKCFFHDRRTHSLLIVGCQAEGS